jgi:hypothetical protein
MPAGTTQRKREVGSAAMMCEGGWNGEAMGGKVRENDGCH